MLCSGLVFGLILSTNFFLASVISYFAIYTNLLCMLFAMYLFIKAYRHFIGVDIKVINGFFLMLPALSIGLLIMEYSSKIDLSGNRTWHYGDNYYRHLAEEIFYQSLWSSFFFAFIFLPLHRLAKKKSEMKDKTA